MNQTIDTHAATYSNIGLGVAIGYAALDPILSGIREKSARTALVDGMIYLEALAVTSGVTNLSKLAVRRPRPIAYIEFNACAKKHPNAKPSELTIVCDNSSTDSSLSFVSGHASTVGAITGTATYLAFARSPHSWRPWVTLLAGTAVTFFVSFERVRSGEHFPTNVVAGAFGGAGVGVLTAHLHREDSTKNQAALDRLGRVSDAERRRAHLERRVLIRRQRGGRGAAKGRVGSARFNHVTRRGPQSDPRPACGTVSWMPMLASE